MNIKASICCSFSALFIAGAAFSQSPQSPQSLPNNYRQSLVAPDRTGAVASDYRLGPLDKISINVFGQKDLSVDKIQVDSSGVIVLPLVGAIQAGGKTAAELSTDIADRLGEKFLQSPSVSVLIEDAVSQHITVNGAVTEAGVYSLKGRTTLMQAIALAKGTDPKFADMKHVLVFRTIDGKRAAAMFDLTAILQGRSDDPEVFGEDSIVVQNSRGKQIWREVVATLPGLAVFAYF